jgi:hypothetical protein
MNVASKTRNKENDREAYEGYSATNEELSTT